MAAAVWVAARGCASRVTAAARTPSSSGRACRSSCTRPARAVCRCPRCRTRPCAAERVTRLRGRPQACA
eukprot:4474610-Prymnesium_polylepis.1